MHTPQSNSLHIPEDELYFQLVTGELIQNDQNKLFVLAMNFI